MNIKISEVNVSDVMKNTVEELGQLLQTGCCGGGGSELPTGIDEK